MPVLKKVAPFLVALILLFFAILSLDISHQESTTFDEKAHIPSSYSYIRYGDMRLNPEHPPLLKDLAGLSLLPLHPAFPIDSKEWQSGINAEWVIGDQFINCSNPKDVCNNPDDVTFFARLPITAIAILLGIFIYTWTKELAGTWAGLFALLLYAFDPNVIAHSHYVTTDIGIAAFTFFSFYYFIRSLKVPTWKNVLISGVFLALAQLAKFSAVLLFPIFGLFVILYALTRHEAIDDPHRNAMSKWSTLGQYTWKYAVSVAVCFALIWILYYLNTRNMPGDKLIAIANGDPGLGPFARHVIEVTSSNAFLKPLSAYFLGIFIVFARVAGGNTYFFLGTVSNKATMFYFPVVFILKETLPFLVLLVLTTGYTLYRMSVTYSREKANGICAFLANSFQNRLTQYLCLFFVLVYSYTSIAGNLNIGFRHLFPMLPILYMLVAKTLFDIFKRAEGPTRTIFGLVIGGFTIAIVAIPVLAYPYYLSYFNAIAGGHANGYRYVTDSNYDWGQDAKRLRNWVENCNRLKEKAIPMYGPIEAPCDTSLPPIDKIRVDYFGGSSPKYYLGDKFVPWYSTNTPEAGWYAISAGLLQVSTYEEPTPGQVNYRWLLSFSPVARVGDSIFIFYIPPMERSGSGGPRRPYAH